MPVKGSTASVTLSLAICGVFAPSELQSQRAGVPEERARLAQITGDSLLRQPGGDARVLLDSTAGLKVADAPMRVAALRPEIAFTWNSAIPYSVNDGAMWAGRGANVAATFGVRAVGRSRFGTLRVDLAPSVLHSQNRVFDVRSDSTPERSSYASPFHRPPFSADLPLRFGDRSLTWFTLGASAIELRADRVGISAGAAAGNELWGPGIRNQLVMSANAEGFPRLFLGTSAPRKTRVGLVRAKLISGVLTESWFFDRENGNDHRSLSGVLLELTPAFDSTLTFGAMRIVYRPVSSGFGAVPEAVVNSFDALIRWEGVDLALDAEREQQSDQITALFARWIVPSAGFEAYTEVARAALPSSLGDLLRTGHSVGYTVGAQLAQPLRAATYLRYQAEFTNLEQSRDALGQPPEFYSGQASLQGYTNRGQVIGAAIGPGGSSQFVGVDYLRPRWQAGAYTARVRTETDALFRQPAPNQLRYDVTWLGGIRGAWRSRWTDFALDVTYGYRFNYLFQNGTFNYGGYRTVDVRNLTVALSATPRH